MRVLLVEDDRMVGKAVQQGLTRAGFVVDWVTDGMAAEHAADNGVYDIAILDLGLPKKDGRAVLASLRARRNGLPVLIATARDGVSDRIDGLNIGADDYLLKPFDLDELVARVQAVVRRHHGSASPVLTAGPIVMNLTRRSVTRDGVAVDLSVREFAIREALMRRPADVLSRERLEESVYGWSEDIASNAIEVHVHHLRRKLGADTIKNIRGVGYRLADG
jgi:DNA-binding response OmpR family regulator